MGHILQSNQQILIDKRKDLEEMTYNKFFSSDHLCFWLVSVMS